MGWLSPDPSGWQWWCAQLIVDQCVHSLQGMTQKCQARHCPLRMVAWSSYAHQRWAWYHGLLAIWVLLFCVTLVAGIWQSHAGIFTCQHSQSTPLYVQDWCETMLKWEGVQGCVDIWQQNLVSADVWLMWQSERSIPLRCLEWPNFARKVSCVAHELDHYMYYG